MPSKSISVFRERYCRRVVRDLPKDLEPDELDPLGVLRARVAPALAAQPAAPRGTPAHRRPAHFNIPGSPPSSRPLSPTRERSFHLGVNKPVDRPARLFDRYATSKGAVAETTVNHALELPHHVGDLEPVRDNGAALYDRYAASHGGMVAVPDHDTTLSRDPALRAQQWDAVEEHERSHRVKREPGPPRIAIFYERAPELFNAAAAQARCPRGLRDLIAKEQRRVTTGDALSKIHQTLGMEWIDDAAPAAQDWLARLPGWDPDTSKDKRLSRASQGRGPLTHIAGEIEYPKELLAERSARERIRRGLFSWFDDLGRDGEGDASILPAAVYDHLPDRLNDRRNMHCHFIIGTRRATVGEGGELAFADHKVNAITRMGFHERLREKFADLVNVELERLAVDHRLHPGTHTEMGIDHVTPNRKVSGRGTVLERASIPTADGLFNDIENWSRKFDLAAKRYQMRQQQIADTNANDAARAMMLQAATLRYEAEQIGLLVGMSVSRAKRTARFAPAYADAAKRDRDRQGWLARGVEAEAYLGALDDDLVEERRAIIERRREAARLDRAVADRAVSERRVAIEAAAARAASHRAVNIVARTPLLITELDGTYAIERRDDPEGLVAGIDLAAVDIQKRLQGQHTAQRKALAQVRSYMHKHGHAGLFDEAKIGRSAWLRNTIEQWRSSPIITREEAERSVRADAHRATLVARNTAMRTGRSETIDQLAELGLVELAPEPTLPTPVERVEIVKGPVSSLYGRNAFAGAINYVSKRPTDEWHATGLARGGEYGSYTVTGDVNGPIIPGLLRVGLAGNYQRSDGAYKDPITGRRAGGFEKKDFKGTFDLAPSDRVNIGGTFYYGNDHFDQTPNVYVTNNCAGGTAFCGPYNPNPIEISNIPASSGNSGNTRKVYNASLRGSWDMGFATLSALGGYNKVTQRGYQDFTAQRNGLVFNLNPGPGTANVYELFGADDNTEDYSGEIRLSTPTDKPLRISIGGDYYHLQLQNTTLIGLNGAQIPAGQSVSSASNFFLAGLFVTPDGSPSTSNYTQNATVERTFGAFGSVDWDIASALTLRGELRYTDDRQSLDIQRNSFVANTFRPFGLVPDIGFHYFNYRGSAQYKLSGRTNVYASVASGTKAGGFNGRATIASELSYQPEDNTTYEVGLKTSTPNNKFGLDVAVYHIDSSGLQINGISDDPKNVGQVVKNFGGTTNTGFEISTYVRPAKDLVFSLGFAYTNPKFTNGTNDVNGVTVCAQVPSCAGRIITIQTARGPMQAVNLQGLLLQRASRYQVNVAADYKHSLGGDFTGFAHADLRLESRQYANLDDLYYIKDRVVGNTRIGVGKGPFELALVVRNLFDDRIPVYPTQNTQLNNFSNIFVANLPEPRTISGELAFRF